jgi:hypothetical protein
MLGILGMISGIGSTKIGVKKTAPTYNLSAITPTISFQGKSVSPASGVVQNFTSPVKYTVTAIDGSSVTYTVTTKPVTCPDYYTNGIPFGGKITSISEVNVVLPGGEIGEDEPWILKLESGAVPALLLKGYKVTVQEESLSTEQSPVIDHYCGKPKQLNYFYWKKPAENSYVLGVAHAFPTIWVNKLPNCQVFCSYEQLKLVKTSSLNY